ncbi:radical SAM protein [Methanothermococcus okinawensis]|uniref:Radical SAM domain protein n=1 Tax=Methanothermococcus okinawensis (strain DSM 14208 / JCM 11175 / IH1) TaxID=647113 RepID=F8ANE0_METOI|nr:radical SAM protein [Methanothermococcus okinawensis]AEH06200.1 Radical SAM domain protein [Methanothermococcus okinawensis IH1]
MDIEELERNLFKNIKNLPVGCQYCIRGEKLVLFITGLCGENCFYCPVSENRKEKDIIYANERKINSVEEAINEAHLCGSKGVGITGGNPLLKIERTCEYIGALKNEFNSNFHTHLYTTPTHLDEDKLKMLKNAGLDEIRLHPTKFFNIYGKKDFDSEDFKTYMDDFLNKLKLCMKYIKDVGVEIPVIPNMEEEIIYLAEELNRIGVKFLNINELEYSETNYNNLKHRGFKEKNDYASEILGSEETAKKVIDYFKEKKKVETEKDESNTINKFNLIIHYCPSALKDGIQMKNRLINRAKNTAKDYDIITNEGLILRGIISFNDLENIKDIIDILDYNELPYEVVNNNIYLNPYVLEDLIDELKNMDYNINFSAYISERYPTSDGLEVERTPLIVKKRSLKSIRRRKNKKIKIEGKINLK